MLALLAVASAQDIAGTLAGGIPSFDTASVYFQLKISEEVAPDRWFSLTGDAKVAENGVQVRGTFAADAKSMTQADSIDFGVKALAGGLNVAMVPHPSASGLKRVCVQDTWPNWQSAGMAPDPSSELGELPPVLKTSLHSIVFQPTHVPGFLMMCNVPGFNGCNQLKMDTQKRPLAFTGTMLEGTKLEIVFGSWSSEPEKLSSDSLCKDAQTLEEDQQQGLLEGLDKTSAAAEHTAPQLHSAKKYAVQAAQLAAMLGSPHMHQLYSTALEEEVSNLVQNGLSFAAGGLLVGAIALAVRRKVNTHAALLDAEEPDLEASD